MRSLTLLLVVVLNVGKYAPRFKLGFTVMSVISVGEFAMIFVMLFFVTRDKKKAALKNSQLTEEPISLSHSVSNSIAKEGDTKNAVLPI